MVVTAKIDTGPRLQDLLEFRDQDVLDAFCATFDIPEPDAAQIFADVMRFLWLSTSSEVESVRSIDAPIVVIDEMWHTFILFTKQYHRFCHRYFGRYIHHAPTTERERKQPPELGVGERRVAEKRERFEHIYEGLGREVFIRWYFEYPSRFSPRKLQQLRKK